MIKVQAVMRKTLSGSYEPFSFNAKSRRFYVENFSDSDIYVSFADDTNDSSALKIRAGEGKLCSIMADDTSFDMWRTTIYAKGTGEVEIQALDIAATSNAVDEDDQSAHTSGTVQDHTLNL